MRVTIKPKTIEFVGTHAEWNRAKDDIILLQKRIRSHSDCECDFVEFKRCYINELDCCEEKGCCE